MENGSDSEMTDHMNKHEDARRNVSIRRIIIIMALVTTVISILLLTATYYMSIPHRIEHHNRPN